MQDAREILAQLAQDYSKKLAELEDLITKTASVSLVPQLQALGERSTGRFRSVQHALLKMLTSEDRSNSDSILGATTALCVCFDEMHILLQVLLELYAKEKANNATH